MTPRTKRRLRTACDVLFFVVLFVVVPMVVGR